jgi:tetratricopeptide (TPR) repeat protein
MTMTAPFVRTLCTATLCVVTAAGFLPRVSAQEADSGDIRIVIARPRDLSLKNEIDDKWFAALAEQYSYMRFSQLGGITPVPRDSLERAINGYEHITNRVSDGRYRELARAHDATHIVMQKYEIIEKMMGKNRISYMAEVFSVAGKTIVGTFERTITGERLAPALDSCVRSLGGEMGSTIPVTGFTQQIVSRDGNDVRELGDLLLGFYYTKDRDTEEIAASLHALSQKSRRMKLASFHAGKAFLASGKWEKAASLFGALTTSLSPAYPAVYTHAARAHFKNGNYDEAIRIADLGMRSDVAPAVLQPLKAQCLKALGKRRDAFELYTGIYERDSLVQAAVFMARYYNETNKPGNARQYASRILRTHVSHVPALVEKGEAHIRLGEYEEAVQALELAISSADSAMREADSLYAVALAEKGAHAQAAQRFSALAQGAQTTPAVLHSAAREFEKAGNTGEAAAHYARYLEIDTTDVEAMLTLARLYEQQGDYENAARRYEDAYAVRGEQQLLKKAGDLLYEHDLTSKAQQVYRRYLDEGHEDMTIRLQLARTHYDQQQYEEVTSLLGDTKYASELETEELFMVARSFYLTGALKKASAFFSRVVARQPNHRRALRYSGIIKEKLGSISQACELYRSYIRYAPADSARVYGHHCARLYKNNGYTQEAIAQYRRTISAHPDDIRNYQDLVALYLDTDNAEAAARILDDAVERFPEHTPFSCTYATVLERLGQPDKAIRHFDACAQARGDDSSFIKMADLLYEQEQFADAVPAYRKAVKRAPYDWRLHYRLGASLLRTGNADEAIPALEDAREFKPADMQVLSLLDSCYRITDDPEARIEVMKKLAARSDSPHYRRLLQLGMLLKRAERTAQAKTYLQKAAQVTDTDPAPHIALAQIALPANDYTAVITHLSKAVSLGNHSFETYIHLADAYANENELKKATDYYYKAVEKRPDNAAAHYSLFRALARSDRDKAAFPHLEKAAALDPDNRTYAMALAQTLYEQDRRDKAAAILNRILRKNPDDPAILQQAARLYYETGRRDSALVLYKKTLRHHADCGVCRRRIGDIHFSRDDYHSASTYYERYLSEHKSYDVQENLAICLYKQGEEKKARDMLESLLAQTDRNRSRFWLGYMYLSKGRLMLTERLVTNARHKDGWYFLLEAMLNERRGNYKQAYTGYSTAQRALPENVHALAGAGRMMLKKGDYDKAIHFFGRAVGMQEHNPMLLTGLGHAYELKQQYASAISIYEKALDIAADNIDAYFSLARVYSKDGSHLEAIRVLKKGIDRAENPARLYMALGHEYRLTRQYNDAVDAYKICARKGGQPGVEAYRYIGNIYYGHLKKMNKAKKFYKKYIRNDGKKAADVKRILDKID